MGSMKKLYEQIVDDIAWGHASTTVNKPIKTLFVLSCNGEPLCAYVSREMAEYEAWVCRQGEQYVCDVPSEYTITLIPVCEETQTCHA